MIINGTNVQMTRGDTESLTVSCVDLPFEAGDVVELTIRKAPNASDIYLHKTVTEFTADGKAEFVFEPSDTEDLAFGKYSYDVQATFVTIGVKTIIKPSLFKIGEECTYV